MMNQTILSFLLVFYLSSLSAVAFISPLSVGRSVSAESRRVWSLKSRWNYDDDDGDYDVDFGDKSDPFGRRRRVRRRDEGREGFGGLKLPESLTRALLAGVFVLGIGTGVTMDSGECFFGRVFPFNQGLLRAPLRVLTPA